MLLHRPGIVQDAHLRFLDELRNSGTINMFGATEPLIEVFELDRTDAKRVLTYWMGSYQQRHAAPSGGFEEWMEKVNKVLDRYGITTDDLPDCPYRDWFDDGVLPGAAAGKAIQNAADDDGLDGDDYEDDSNFSRGGKDPF